MGLQKRRLPPLFYRTFHIFFYQLECCGLTDVQGLNFPRGRLLVSLALISGIGYTGATLSFYRAIQLAPVNLVIVIAYMYPTRVTLFLLSKHSECPRPGVVQDRWLLKYLQ